MKNKVVNISVVFAILFLALICLTACNSNNSSSKEENYFNGNLVEIQSNIESAISELQVSFMTNELSINSEAKLYDYITLNNFNEAIKKYGYSICLSNNLKDIPENMNLYISEDNIVYFTDGDYIFKVELLKINDDDQFNVMISNIELIK
jgi:uncharacterized protein YneR